jgi:hypothetical protein
MPPRPRKNMSKTTKTTKSRKSRRTTRTLKSSRKSIRGGTHKKGHRTKSRRGRSRSRSRQEGGFWLTNLIFGRKKTRYDNVVPATNARNAFLGPYREFEKAGDDLLEKHKQKEETMARLEKALLEAKTNVESTSGNVATFKQLQMNYRKAAKNIVDEYNRDMGASTATMNTAAINAKKINNSSSNVLLAELQRKNARIAQLEQEIKQKQLPLTV